MKIIDYPVIVVVWSQEGCPGCSSYLPKFRKVAPKYQTCIPSIVVSAENFGRAADHYRIRVTPTTSILRYGRQSPSVLEGDADPNAIEGLFQTAMVGMDCQIRRH